MKTRIPLFLSAIAILLLSPKVYGQDGFSAGAKVIGNVTKFGATNPGFGYGVGGFATLPIVGPLSVRAELLYVSYAGTTDDITKPVDLGAIESVTYKNRNLRFHSAEIPVMAVVNLPFLKSLNPKVSAGYAFSYNIFVYQISDNDYSAKDANGAAKTYSYTNTTENVTSEFAPTNSSVLGSLSFNFERMHVDLRYQQGLVNLTQSNAETGRYPGDYKSKTISISLGYRFL